MGNVILVSGPSGCGKTTLCARVVDLARAAGLAVAGVITWPRFVDGRKVGLDVEDLQQGDRRPLAESAGMSDGPSTGAWHFHAAGLAFGAQALARATPCHLLVVDELGPLELERGEGWRAGLDALVAGGYRLGLAVVRPALVAALARRLGTQPPVVTASVVGCDALAARILRELGDWG
ncbi:MAG TPA: nucleoside-triphosphatase [Anaerolineae bacterium]|nr:nucleoside-triphosphatase [Anaerolineae bacterium]HOQ97253.1 nucleoside-triphosphatase [Anaerolineae bacterium]HPL27655.1 nucleoside-triphosphatase [Anaerolineae bacterium]